MWTTLVADAAAQPSRDGEEKRWQPFLSLIAHAKEEDIATNSD